MSIAPARTATPCPACNEDATVVADAYPGYRAGTTFSIAACRECESSFALPLASDSALYDAIYSQQALIPGYDRYDAYARRIVRERDPLAYLARSEENYWAVGRVAAALPRDAKVLDVGCGLGYVTYALAKSGIDATGLELSQNAVNDARARFGDHFVAADLFAWAETHRGAYDVVVMLEFIEHVEEPLAWIEAGLSLLKPGGKLLLSTPNRDFYPPGTVWETEAPPVHLWWFTPAAFRRLAARADATIEIMDLSECEVGARPAPVDVVRTHRSPMLTVDSRPISRLRAVLYRLGLLGVAKAAYELANARRAPVDGQADRSHREVLVGIFGKR